MGTLEAVAPGVYCADDPRPAEVVGELLYLSYAYNRQTMSAAKLADIFDAPGALEARYRREFPERVEAEDAAG